MHFNPFSWLVALCAPGRKTVPVADQRHLELMIRMELMSDTVTTTLATTTDRLMAQIATLNQGLTAVWARVQAKDVAMAALLKQVTDVRAQVVTLPADTAEVEAKLSAVSAQLAAAITTADGIATTTFPTVSPEPAPANTDPAPAISDTPESPDAPEAPDAPASADAPTA